jgi:hypothetical protein
MKTSYYLLFGILIMGCHHKREPEPDVAYRKVYQKLTQNGFYKNFGKYDLIFSRAPHCYLVSSSHPDFTVIIRFIEPESIEMVNSDSNLREAIIKVSPDSVEVETKRITKEIANLVIFMEKESIQSVVRMVKDSLDYRIDFNFTRHQSLRFHSSGIQLPFVEKIDSFWVYVKLPPSNDDKE